MSSPIAARVNRLFGGMCFKAGDGRVLISGFLCATSVSLCLCGELLLSNVNHRGTETQRLHREELLEDQAASASLNC